MDSFYFLFMILLFLAVVLAIEGVFMVWNNSRSPEARRMAQRLRAMSAGEHGSAPAALLKQRPAAALSEWERRLLSLPHMHRLELLLQQAGVSEPASHVALKTLFAALAALLAAHLLHAPNWLALAAMLGAGAVFPARLLAARRKRLRDFEQQLPEALDLLARALRAGHAFSSALGMVASEAHDPIAGEFRITFDEVNYGLSLHDALLNLVTRVPSTDLRYFVIAVQLQRDTGGNLAELLANLSALIRARFKLVGTVRVLSAEGRLSAWVLTLMPFVAAAMVNLINPKFMSVLWTDPVGLQMVWTALAMAVLGIFWMWRIVSIRV